MKVLQINTQVHSGSIGRIVEGIGRCLIAQGHQSYVAFGRGKPSGAAGLIKIGNEWDQKMHGLKTRLFDRHGFGSRKATTRFIQEIHLIDPDIIHLHNLHGYYLHIQELFNYLKSSDKTVVWTFHDCWPFTGHCAYFERVGCYKWRTQCFHCPLTKMYPASWGWDNSRKNYQDKRKIFTGMRRLWLVAPSQALARYLKESFLRAYPMRVIPNGVDIEIFKPRMNGETIKEQYGCQGKKIVLGLANIWSPNKGFADFIALSEKIPDEARIVLVGLNKEQLKGLPKNILAIPRTESLEDLASLYSAADVFVNPTYADNFPTTNLEALACGTPVITYNTGGSPEAIDGLTGAVIEKGDLAGLKRAIEKIFESGKKKHEAACRKRAETLFDYRARCGDYLTLYKQALDL